MSKKNIAGQRTRQPKPTKIIVERHYVGTEMLDGILNRAATAQSLRIKIFI